MTQHPAPTTGSISTTERPDATVVYLAGRVDAGLRTAASHALGITVQRRLPVVLDTTGLTFIDSAGLAFLIQCGTTGLANGVRVDLLGAPSHLTDRLETVGALPLFGAVEGIAVTPSTG